MFSKWWRKRDKSGEKERNAPTEAWEQTTGTMITTDLTAPHGARSETLEVLSAGSLEHNATTRRELDLGTSSKMTLRAWSEDSGALALAREMTRDEVINAFSAEVIGAIVSEDAEILERVSEIESLDGWTAKVYRREACETAKECDETGTNTEIDFYRFVSDERTHAVEIRIFDGGRTEIWAVRMNAQSCISGIYPKTTR